jgi:peptidoglycan/LPS O-acetylase OafA/YrhL
VLPQFAAGMILYRLYRMAALPSWLTSDAAFIATVGALVGCGIAGVPDCICVMLLAVLLLSAARSGSLAARILAIRPLPYLGEISYSLYMVQIIPSIIIEVLLPPLAPALQDFIFIVGSFALAIPMSRFVEYPARAWLKEARWPRAPFRLAASPSRDRVETQHDAPLPQ